MLEKQIYNPYLPMWEYVPDGEPHVFGNRVYVYGSHDKADGQTYCEENYVVWSAPVEDLTDWKCHGISYRKEQDPHNISGQNQLWAPDVCRGSDGRYYMYYCLAFEPEIGIAVSDNPEGPFEFYNYVRDPEGNIWHEDLPFDPGVLYEDEENIWLYSGFGAVPIPEVTKEMLKQQENLKNIPDEKLDQIYKQVQVMAHTSKNCSCLRLDKDMKTIRNVTAVIPTKSMADHTSFAEHPFYEASSIRKIGDLYYLVYSSLQGHELCYAVSQYADRDFTFGGVIISNCDLGVHENEKARTYYGNNHGGMENINGQWYIFYHRHTNKTQFSRQGCAEKIEILEDGSIPQVEMTSCGLNNGPLKAGATYPAAISCNLWWRDGGMLIEGQHPFDDNIPFLTEENGEEKQKIMYVCNMHKSAICGIKYLEFNGEKKVGLKVRGKGTIEIKLDSEYGDAIGRVEIDSEEWQEYIVEIAKIEGVHAVYFEVKEEEHAIDFQKISFM